MIMRAKNLLHLIPLCSLLLALNPATSQAQNATYIGPATGGDWNTATNWDLGIPAPGTNATINAGTNVNYNLQMTTGGFALLTNSGVLNINTNDFVCTGIAEAINSGGDKIFFNNGAGVTVNGNVTLATNAAATMSAGASLTINGALDVDFGSSSKATGTATFTNSGGLLIANSTAVNNNSGTGVGLFVISGGTNNLGTTVVGRQGGASFSTLGTEGLIIYNGLVTMTNLNAGNNGTGNSSLTVLVANGVVTNYGNMYVNQGTGGRGSRFLQSGGFFTTPDPGIVNLNGYAAQASPVPTSAVLNIYAVTGGTNVVGGFLFGNTNGNGETTVDFTNSSVLYVGSQGIASNGVSGETMNISLNNGGLFGATAPWTNYVQMKLPSGAFTFQTADMANNPNNITIAAPLSGNGGIIKTASGTLVMTATNTYLGNTLINAGTLSLGSSGVLTSGPLNGIYVGSGATFDVSELTSAYAVTSGQTLGGYGSVTGAVTVASGGIIEGGSNIVTGTLTLQSGLVETNGAINAFWLSNNPLGGNNDFISSPNGLTVSGANTINITGSLQSGGVYPLIYYGSGGFSGSLSDFTVTGGDAGSLSNSAAAETIYFVAQTSVRNPTNIVWLGNSIANNWNIETATNWLNVGTGNLDYFVPGDFALFSNQGGVHPLVNITTTVAPGTVTINTTSNYTFTGNGNITGSGSLTVSNGTLTVLTTNTYTGPTVLAGGVLSTPIIANSGTGSGIGGASSDPGNLILSGGTLNVYANSGSTDHGMTLTNGGGIIDVSNSISLTLNGNIVGPGTLTAVDTGTLILNNANSYTNSTTVLASTLQLNNGSGAGTGTINLSNSVLTYYPSGGITVGNPFNFEGTTNMIVVTSGSGGNPLSDGNWTGSGVILVSNTYNPFTVNGTLDGFTGTIQVVTPNAAAFRFNSGGGNSCFGSTNATFDLGTNGVLLNRNGGTMNLGALKGEFGSQLQGQDADTGTTIWIIGWNNQSTAFAGTITNGNASRIAALTKVGTGTLALDDGYSTNVTLASDGFTEVTNIGLNSLLLYTGDTTVSNGTLALIGGASLTNSPVVTLAASTAVIDASQMAITEVTVDSTNIVTNSTFEVVSGQTLNGIGTLNGILQQDASSTFNVGLPTGSFTVTTNASLSGAINMSLNGSASSEVVSPAITVNASTTTLVVTNAGSGLINGVTFHLFSQGVSGSFASVTLPATDPTGTTNYVWANNLTSNGTITLTSGGLVAAAPKITFGVSAGTLSLSWGSTGYTLQVQTNALNVGLSTNWVNVPGSTSLTGTNITINPSTGTEFFRLMQ